MVGIVRLGWPAGMCVCVCACVCVRLELDYSWYGACNHIYIIGIWKIMKRYRATLYLHHLVMSPHKERMALRAFLGGRR